MSWIVSAGVVWFGLALLVALGLGRAMQIRDRRERPVANSRCDLGCPCGSTGFVRVQRGAEAPECTPWDSGRAA